MPVVSKPTVAEKIARLEDEIDSKQRRVEDLEGEIDELHERIRKLKASVLTKQAKEKAVRRLRIIVDRICDIMREAMPNAVSQRLQWLVDDIDRMIAEIEVEESATR